MHDAPAAVRAAFTGLCLLVALGIQPARAHEFWIEPLDFSIAGGEPLQAHLYVGQRMQGNTLLYLPHQFNAFDLTIGDQTRPVESRIGDSPAVHQTAFRDGLAIISYVSTDSLLTYTNPHKFETFLRDEGIEWVAAVHRERGLPEVGFTEAFQRFAKSLVRIGDGGGADRALGLEFELVVETNPYRGDARDLEIRLLWRGEPFPDARITVFRRHYDDVRKTYLTTDGEGRARLPVTGAPGVYLLNAVHMIEPPPNDGGVVWKSLWASTTFEITD
jgi:hypothetical protein